jgi:hypothetical protein
MTTTTSIEADILESERLFWLALQNQDVDAALELTDERCLLTGAQGVHMIDHDHLRTMMKSANYTLDSFELKDGAQVRLLRDDVATIGYEIHEEMTVEGKTVTLDAADASVWVRRDGRWLCALHTESIAGDPFGRDRNGKQAAAKGR